MKTRQNSNEKVNKHPNKTKQNNNYEQQMSFDLYQS